MKQYLSLTVMIFSTISVFASVDPNYVLPENGKIKTAILTGSYSCGEAGPLKSLNLNGETYQGGEYYPDMQINFACGSTPEIEGTDLSLIADLGDRKLEDLDYYLSLTPKWQVGESYNFRKSAKIKENNTYAVVLNSFKYRGLLVFRVISYRENILTIQYSTRTYSLIRETAQATFIEHEKKNSN